MTYSLGNLRIEKSKSFSGTLLNVTSIPLLKEDRYYVKNIQLDGDAPKQFIRAYFFEEDSSIRKSSRSSWPAFIAKTAEKWYPHESVIEYMINRIGEELGLRMNGIRLVRANGQIRFLSRYFLNKNERLVHGAEICGEHLGDMEMAKEIAENRKTARELFTFEFIRDAIRSVFPECFEDLLYDLVKMIVFDGLTGNNDRHFYNWGVIDTKKKSCQLPTFAPLYDSARGLLWNMSDEAVMKHLDEYQRYCTGPKKYGSKIVNYVRDASPRISIEGNEKANHFELIDFLKRYGPEYRQIADELASPDKEERVLHMLKTEFYPMFIKERTQLLSMILQERFETVRNL